MPARPLCFVRPCRLVQRALEAGIPAPGDRLLLELDVCRDFRQLANDYGGAL
jgi:hypothetical protein